MRQVSFFLDDSLKNTLAYNALDVSDYMPAYNGESAGLDLFYVATTPLTIPPAYRSSADIFKLLIPTGLRLKLDTDQVGLLRERGSVLKTPLILRAGVIDSGYQGEIFVNCLNLSDRNFTLQPHTKLPFQLVVTPVHNCYIQVQDFTSSSLRGEGSIGSSDKE